MDVLAAMRIFVKVVELKSYVQTADALHMGVPRVSRTISELETHLGARLLQRTTRRMSLTEAGYIYFERCRQILGEVDDTYTILSTNAVSASGRLRIVAPSLFAIHKLSPVLSEYRRAFPKVTVDLTLADRTVDLIEEAFDLGIIEARHIVSQTLVSRCLTKTEYIPCASPEYLERHKEPRHPSELEAHDCIVYRTENTAGSVVFVSPDGVPIQVPMTSHLYVNNIGMVRECTLSGMGVGMLSTYLADEDIRTGRLRRLLPDYKLAAREFHLVYSNRRFLPLKVKAFADITIDYFSRCGNAALRHRGGSVSFNDESDRSERLSHLVM